MTNELRKEIEEKADNYILGLSMMLALRPLSLEDVKIAFMAGVEEMEYMIKYNDNEQEVKV